MYVNNDHLINSCLTDGSLLVVVCEVDPSNAPAPNESLDVKELASDGVDVVTACMEALVVACSNGPEAE